MRADNEPHDYSDLLNYSEAERTFKVLFGDEWEDAQAIFTFYGEDKSLDRGCTSFLATLHEAWPKIERFIASSPIAAVAFCPNITDGTLSSNISAIRFLRVDIDHAEIPTWLPRSTLVVSSSPWRTDKKHVYYAISDFAKMGVCEMLHLQRILGVACGADMVALNANRVLRLPGTPHRKALTSKHASEYDQIGMCKIASGDPDAVYTYDAFLERMPKLDIKARDDSRPEQPTDWPELKKVEGEDLNRAITMIKRAKLAISGDSELGGGVPLFTAAARLIRGYKMPIDQADLLLRLHYNPLCRPPWDFESKTDAYDWDRALVRGPTTFTKIKWGELLSPKKTEGIAMGEPWGKVTDFTQEQIRQSEPFPVHALPDVMAEVVADVITKTKAPEALVAQCALGVGFSASLGVANIDGPTSKNRPLSANLLAIACPNERKSSIETLLTRDMSKYQRECEDAAKKHQKTLKTAYAIWKKQVSIAEKAMERWGNGEGDSAQDAKATYAKLLDEEPDLNAPWRKFLYQETTVEGLVSAMCLKSRYASVMTDEGGSFFGGHSMKREQVSHASGIYNKLWSGSDIEMLRKGTSKGEVETLSLRGGRLCLHIQVQPGVIGRVKDDDKGFLDENGFFARFLVCHPTSTQGTRTITQDMIDSCADNRKTEKFQQSCIAMIKLWDLLADDLPSIELDAEASNVWIKEYDRIEDGLGEGHDYHNIAYMAGKAPEYILRMAGMFHLLGGKSHTQYVTEKTMKDSSEVITWYLGESLRIFDAKEASIEVKDASELAAWLKGYAMNKKTFTLTTRDIARGAPSALRAPARYNNAIKMLSQAGYVRRDSKVIEIYPGILSR